MTTIVSSLKTVNKARFLAFTKNIRIAIMVSATIANKTVDSFRITQEDLMPLKTQLK